MSFRYLFLGLMIINVSRIEAQGNTGGHSSFQFLNVSVSPRNTALGSEAIAWKSADPSSSYYNPALINDQSSNRITFSQMYYIAGINLGQVTYTYHPLHTGLQLMGGVQYLNSGAVPTTDEFGTVTGSTNARESDFFIAASKKINERITGGLSMHYVYSSLGIYSSAALCWTGGLHYSIPDKQTEFAFVVRNAGFSFDPYQLNREKLPVTASLGVAKRLKHLPFVFHITAHHLEYWNVRYDDPNINATVDLFGNVKEKSAASKFTDNLFRHLSFGGEFLIGKSESFSIRLGYNHLRRMEININDFSLFGGLSFGFGFKLYMFRFDYTHANYHLAGGTNQIGITANLNSFFHKKGEL
ncbi:MAG: type IX secretion system protein PorQ [Saprospiraceae bacterium]|nr:type IX secretion system protein PorQ [Saprospiraceae bacterium]HMW38518.1 type IX secretion system protein PorQ [Saprospiraceae bacterium]HMX88348.1 type IX secretion system protein PorQ [Saprospiraceae bacterium]HMZ40240.1 type IX secretion system protein PorQ [Saprospiraceae bacterium]HNA64394.1 type IX secretion system protein PorQ [Saprospiraceae bacterium]